MRQRGGTDEAGREVREEEDQVLSHLALDERASEAAGFLRSSTVTLCIGVCVCVFVHACVCVWMCVCVRV